MHVFHWTMQDLDGPLTLEHALALENRGSTIINYQENWLPVHGRHGPSV